MGNELQLYLLYMIVRTHDQLNVWYSWLSSQHTDWETCYRDVTVIVVVGLHMAIDRLMTMFQPGCANPPQVNSFNLRTTWSH